MSFYPTLPTPEWRHFLFVSGWTNLFPYRPCLWHLAKHESHHFKCHYSEWVHFYCYATCHYAEGRDADSRGAKDLSWWNYWFGQGFKLGKNFFDFVEKNCNPSSILYWWCLVSEKWQLWQLQLDLPWLLGQCGSICTCLGSLSRGATNRTIVLGCPRSQGKYIFANVIGIWLLSSNWTWTLKLYYHYQKILRQ